MKRLPCSKCGLARLPDGKPYALAFWPSGNRHIRFKCLCKTINDVSMMDFNRLPELTTQEAEAQGIIRWDNLDLMPEHIEDFKRWGVKTPGEIHDLSNQV